MQYFNDKIKKPGGVMLDYLTLLSSIPESWKEYKNTSSNKVHQNGIQNKLIFYPLEQCTSKIVRCRLISDISVKPICQIFWERKFPNYNFVWETIWKNIPSHANEARLITLNWKILSNIYPTNILLEKMGIARSNMCEKCNEKDYLEHFFFNCKIIRNIWSEINNMITEEIGKIINISLTDAMFGFCKGNDKENKYVNRLIVIAKLCISKYKYGKHPNLIFLFEKELNIRKWSKL